MAAKEKTSWLTAWLAPILLLLAALPASALTARATETRAWEKTSVPLESRPLESLQLLNLHQPKAIAGDNDALGSPLAAESAPLTQQEARALQKIENAIRDHMTPGDLSGSVADQMGSPIPKPSGGYWDHAQEMNDTLRGLRKNADLLQNSTNPAAQAARQRALDAIRNAEEVGKGAGI